MNVTDNSWSYSKYNSVVEESWGFPAVEQFYTDTLIYTGELSVTHCSLSDQSFNNDTFNISHCSLSNNPSVLLYHRPFVTHNQTFEVCLLVLL